MFSAIFAMLINGPFNLRVYGLCLDGEDIWISKEVSEKYQFTKFPGGGLQAGEGLADCLRREWKEETGVEPDSLQFYFVNDFYQESAFNPNQQIFAFYFLVQCKMPDTIIHHDETRWNSRFDVSIYKTKLSELTENDLTFPIDKLVLQMLKNDQRIK